MTSPIPPTLYMYLLFVSNSSPFPPFSILFPLTNLLPSPPHSPPPQLSSLAVRITLLTVIHTASDDSCSGRPVRGYTFAFLFVVFWEFPH